MKIGGCICLFFGVLNLLISLAGLNDYPEQAAQKLVFGAGMTGLGVYLLNRAKQKQKEDDDNKKWNEGQK